MAPRISWRLSLLGTLALTAFVLAAASRTSGEDWRSAGSSSAPSETKASTPPESAALQSATTAQPRQRRAKVSNGSGSLPNDQGQLWREYDITPYTLQVASTNRPELAIVDWILRETGYEAWHGEPLAILSADRRTLRVYHTAQMQAVVADIVDRFVCNDADTTSFVLRVATVNSPNWRTRAHQFLQPVEVQTPGVQAWLLERETAATLVAEMRRRTDFREHSSPQRMVSNGQSTVVSATRGRYYVRDALLTGNVWPGYQAQTAVADEGFSLEFIPLLSLDGNTVDAVLKCEITHLEKMVPVMLDVPTPVTPRQRTQIEVPQMAQFQFHERFQWPTDKVLLVGMGMVPQPIPADDNSLMANLPLGLGTDPDRADLLILIEAKDEATELPSAATASRPGGTYRGRY